ncbi:paraquat-inducible protein A [Shewanella submarina]|uniref:Paraquat-inducible protein A n=1 Tax=Shewanella submarina TaxID=2016376 RepID=A0ABV7GH66_9GAMM|nr:paraquat-inducible protein A [Shewanella submarina]MCL1037523.1 paraquat-inducible protein A [Shewanella submarina]
MDSHNTTAKDTQVPEDIVLCRACDLVVSKQQLPQEVRALCPRCHTALYDTPYCSINGMLAICLAALFLYFPANLLPVMELHFFGSVRTTTVMGGATAVLEQGYPVVAIAVMVAAVIAPGLLILSILSQILLIKYAIDGKWGRRLLKLLLTQQSLLTQLSMLEIYLISFLVSAFQLSDHADIYFSIGTFCFTMLFLSVLFLLREYDLQHMWSFLDEK